MSRILVVEWRYGKDHWTLIKGQDCSSRSIFSILIPRTNKRHLMNVKQGEVRGMNAAITILLIFIGFAVYFFYQSEWGKMLFCIIIIALVFTMSLPLIETYEAT